MFFLFIAAIATEQLLYVWMCKLCLYQICRRDIITITRWNRYCTWHYYERGSRRKYAIISRNGTSIAQIEREIMNEIHKQNCIYAWEICCNLFNFSKQLLILFKMNPRSLVIWMTLFKVHCFVIIIIELMNFNWKMYVMDN